VFPYDALAADFPKIALPQPVLLHQELEGGGGLFF
jgi:hypothetical protein